MQRSTKIGLTILVLAIIIAWSVIIFPIVKNLRAMRSQMITGQKYMDSLTEKDFQIWTERTQKYISNFNSTNWLIETKSIPTDLRELKILDIYCESSNSVDYVWMGGFDHTMLRAELLTNGQYRFTAIYNDESNRVIWPKNAEH